MKTTTILLIQFYSKGYNLESLVKISGLEKETIMAMVSKYITF